MKKMFMMLIALAMLLSIVGCGSTGKFVYPAQMSSLIQVDSKPVLHKSVAILPFDDYRSDENSTMFAMYLIPLVPFGWAEYERPEAANAFLSILAYEITPSEDLAKATAVSLRHSNLFENTFFTLGGEKEKADYILTGKIKEMKYQGKIFSYGLSYYGPLFWFLGAPAGTSENKLALELTLKDKSGKIIWDWAMTKEDWIVQWLYYRMGHDCRMFTYMYQNGMNDAIGSLAQKIKEHPELFR